jgi:hypothetical protein
LSRPNIEADKATFVEGLKVLGNHSGNMALRAHLGWSEVRFTKVRTALLDDALIRKGLGRGGSTTLVIKRKKDPR